MELRLNTPMPSAFLYNESTFRPLRVSESLPSVDLHNAVLNGVKRHGLAGLVLKLKVAWSPVGSAALGMPASADSFARVETRLRELDLFDTTPCLEFYSQATEEAVETDEETDEDDEDDVDEPGPLSFDDIVDDAPNPAPLVGWPKAKGLVGWPSSK